MFEDFLALCMKGLKILFLDNPLSAIPTKWSNTLKQFVGKLPTNCLSVFDHFAGLVLKGLSVLQINMGQLLAKTNSYSKPKSFLFQISNQN